MAKTEETKGAEETKAERKGVSAADILAEIKALGARVDSLEAFRRGEEPRFAATVTDPTAE